MCGEWWLSVVANKPTQQAGTVLLETLLALPLMVLFACLWVQVMWLFWAGQTLAVANSYALRTGALNHGERIAIERTLAAAMATIDPTALAHLQLDPNQELKPEDFQAAHLMTAARQQLHLRLAGRVQIRQATSAQFQQFGVRRQIDREWYWVIPNDHLDARAQQYSEDEQEAWLAAQLLELEVWWCLPLHIPFAAQFFAEVAQWSSSPAQQYCNARGAVTETPYWVLTHRVEGPMLSDLIGPRVGR